MPTFKYAKLVRDNIWRWHEECGHTVIGQRLHGASLQKRLSEKLHEEVDEVGAALSREELIEEIADIRQVLVIYVLRRAFLKLRWLLRGQKSSPKKAVFVMVAILKLSPSQAKMTNGRSIAVRARRNIRRL